MCEKKTGWSYGHSDALKQDFAFRKDSNGNLELWTEDKTHYEWKEIELIKAHGGSIHPEVHIVKKMFRGKIVK